MQLCSGARRRTLDAAVREDVIYKPAAAIGWPSSSHLEPQDASLTLRTLRTLRAMLDERLPLTA